jgi:peptide/nickel transport system ATP-binding protein/oligopeptide transport system ATP-binding protein
LTDNLIDINDLVTYFYTDDGIVKAVDSVGFEIAKGETLGLVGESGCGKSTVGLSILRLIRRPGRIVSGEINFEGQNLLDLDEEDMRKIRGKKISMIFQDPTASLNPVFRVGDQIAEAVELHQGLEGEQATDKVIEMLKLVGITDADERYNSYPHELSGGMRQRAMIAMALSCNAALLISDEPTTSLDVTIQAQILELMGQLKNELKISMLLSTHDLGLVAEYSDRVAVMYAGKLAEHADVITIFKKPRHPYTIALMQSIPRADIKLPHITPIPGFVPSLVDPPSGCRFHPRCSHAIPQCRTEEPPQIELSSGHIVFCHWVENQERET